MRTRRGSLLVVVTGLITLLATLAVAFLLRMRIDADDMSSTIRETQARIMLVAACNYIQEASRLGLDDPATPQHEEGFGWVDVRDGKLGPKPLGNGIDDASRFPIGSFARFPMYVMRRPPFAIQRQMVYNPIRTPASDNPLPNTDPIFGFPYLRNPDPQPVVDNGWKSSDLGASVSANNWPAFAAGDRTPLPGTVQQAWFRVYRQGPDEFVVTCGGGGTLGFRDWAEVIAAGAGAQFVNDPAFFATQQAIEMRLWYLVRWSAAVDAQTREQLTSSLADSQRDTDNGTANDDGAPNATDSVRFADNYVQVPLNVENEGGWEAPWGAQHDWRCQWFGPNPVGTISMTMRLRTPPTKW